MCVYENPPFSEYLHAGTVEIYKEIKEKTVDCCFCSKYEYKKAMGMMMYDSDYSSSLDAVYESNFVEDCLGNTSEL